MMATKDEAQALRGIRVAWRVGKVERESVLRAVTPKDMIIFADELGREEWVPLADVGALRAAQRTCDKCGDVVNNVFTCGDQQRCASCTRVWAATQPKPSETCEDCSGLGAYYSPRAKKFRCANCHAKHQSNSGLFVEVRAREAIIQDQCKGEDIHSLRHKWARVRGKWICTGCQTKAYERPAGWRDED